MSACGNCFFRAKRLIDSAELISMLPIVDEDKQISLIGAVADVVTMISECKPVDAVEVVRCAQCKYFGRDGSGYYDDEFYCTNPSGLDGIVKQSDFCSYGERKERRG